jgi:type IV fimbrial biogenesis protein FimU
MHSEFYMELIMWGTAGMRGFTLVELLITLVLVGIVALIAVPSFTQLMQGNQVQAQAEELKIFLQYARSEAVRRGTAVTVAEADDGNAWDIKTSGDEVLRRFEYTPGQAAILSNPDEIIFRANGIATAASVTLCHGDSTETGYRLEIKGSGAIFLYNKGKQDADGTELGSCTP